MLCSIPANESAAILQERHFYEALAGFIREVRQSQPRQLPTVFDSDAEIEGSPPTKKRRLSPNSLSPRNSHEDRPALQWIALQTACRCVDLFNTQPTDLVKNRSSSPIWTAGLQTQASLFGNLLELVSSILRQEPQPANGKLLSDILDACLSFWNGGVSIDRSMSNERHEAFTTYSLVPCLSLLDILMGSHLDHGSLLKAKTALEQLVVLHVVFPLRQTFNEQFTKKWRATTEVLLYEQMETLLQAYSGQIHPLENDGSNAMQTTGGPSLRKMSWIILEVAARSIPHLDLRKRQLEQQYLDSLFIWLVHVTWPHIPRVHSTGVLQQQFAVDHDDWVSWMDNLLDVANSRKLHFSLSIATYLLRAILVEDGQPMHWNLLVKIVQLEPSILVPSSGPLTSQDFLRQVTARIESSAVSQSQYDLLRDQLIITLLRTSARLRNLAGFVDAWKSNISEAIRVGYTKQYGMKEIPAVLIWDDDDVFEEFKCLLPLHGSPNMHESMLKDLMESVPELSEKIGSTAEVFAKIAIFCASLESKSSFNIRLNDSQTADICLASIKSLLRKSDYQGQRWRLRKLVRLLVQQGESQSLPSDLDQLLDSDYAFLSLGDEVWNTEPQSGAKAAPVYLEYVESFFMVVELATRSRKHSHRIEAEIGHLTAQLRQMTAVSLSKELFYNGRTPVDRNIASLLGTCLGNLLQKPMIFSMYPQGCTTLIEFCLETTLSLSGSEPTLTRHFSLLELCQALLRSDGVIRVSAFRQIFLGYITQNTRSIRDGNISWNLIQRLSSESIPKSAVKAIATSLLQHIFEAPKEAAIHGPLADLAFLIYVDSTYGKACIDYRDCRKWLDFAMAVIEQTCPKDSRADNASDIDSTLSYLIGLDMLKQVFRRMWKRSQTISISNPDMIAEMMATVRQLDKQDDDLVQLSCLLLPLACVYQPSSNSDGSLSSNDVAYVQSLLKRAAKFHIEHANRGPLDQYSLLRLKLLADGVKYLGKAGLSEDLQLLSSTIGQNLRETRQIPEVLDTINPDQQLQLSLRRDCFELNFVPSEKANDHDIRSDLHQLLSSVTNQYKWTNESVSLLAAEADLFVRRTDVAEWSSALEFISDKGATIHHQPLCAIIQAAFLSHIEQQHITQFPPLAEELGEIASLENLQPMHTTGLFLGLENCRTVLEIHTSVVNQSTLDRLLVSLHALTSPAVNHIPSEEDVRENFPSPSNIYEKICALLGVILGRYRRRLTDRYHLLLPVLQALLRCIFWPGQGAIENQRGTTWNVIATFGRTLPKWMRESHESLSLQTVDHFCRILSSLCNPTVSAARASNKRSHNELNDVVQKARKLAAQHMQYLVMEYCRCILDGQILPPMKAQLMQGMYRVLDALDRDTMREMNSGMDASSRAIFKALYEDWSKFGKWDKS